MVTISRTVESIVEENAFIEEGIIRGIINYVALAEELQPRISKIMKIKVEISAIVMALRRLREKLKKSVFHRPKFSTNADILITSDLFEVTFQKSSYTLELLRDIYKCIDPERDFIALTHGRMEITLISNKRNKEKIMQLIEKERIVKEIKELASLGITLPAKAIDESGYFYLITRAFAWEGIPLVELISTFTELHIIVHENYVPKAFIILKDVVEKNSD